MITRSHCPRGAALKGYKYSSLLFAPGTVNPPHLAPSPKPIGRWEDSPAHLMPPSHCVSNQVLRLCVAS